MSVQQQSTPRSKIALLRAFLKFFSLKLSGDLNADLITKNRYFLEAWKFLAGRITQAGRWYLTLTMLCSFYGMATWPQTNAYIPLAYVVGFGLVALLSALIWKPRVALTAHHSNRIHAGGKLSIDVDIEQRSRRTVMDLFVSPRGLPYFLTPAVAEGVAVPILKRGEKATVRFELNCERRGSYLLQGYRVQSDFPFGLVFSSQIIDDPKSLLVYPNFVTLNELRIMSGRRYHPGGVALASQLGESFEFIGNREYRPGDSVRDIDWRATARLNLPILREFRQEYFHRVAVVLDTYLPANASKEQYNLFEQSVSLCAAVSDYMARQEYLVDLFAAGPDLYHLTAGRGLAYLDQILDILACVEAGPREPFSTLEPEILEHLSQITTIVCIFSDWNERRRRFVDVLSQDGAAIKVIIVRDTRCSLPPLDDGLYEMRVLGSNEFSAGVTEL